MATRGEEQESPLTRWGTREELLLVSAVNRHGTKNWDSVAMEIQNRLTSSSSLLTPHNCKQRYQQLRRRFDNLKTTATHADNNVSHDTDTDTGMAADTVSWIEELRKLRVAELRREVQQYDVSIVSLQLKVKRLREEREKSFNGEVKPDLEKSEKKLVSGEDSDRENQSFNESNSTDTKRAVESDEKVEVNGLLAGEDLNPVKSGSKPVAEGSYNGSTETVVKDSVNQAFEKSVETIPQHEPGESESPELWVSVAESSRDKDNSDVQSSASLSKETRRKKEVSVSSSGEGPETDDVSPAMNRMPGKSDPLDTLDRFLEILKSHKYGYLFERRLESQETLRYATTIRQHLDLETINNRLREGQYSGDCRKFFGDLLLVFNNAIVFFPRNSDEYTGAIALRQIVSKEMGSRTQKLSKSPEAKQSSPKTEPEPEPEPEPSDCLPIKPNLSIPLIACRKRSSISSKGAGAVLERKVEKKDAVVVEVKKSVIDQTLEDNLVANLIEDSIVIKKGKRDRPPSGTRSSRTGGKSQKNSNSNKNSNLNLTQDPNPSLNPSSSSKGGIDIIDNSPKVEKEKKSDVNTVAKKRSVANFLNRMKKNTSPNGPLLESLKNTGNNFNQGNGGNAEQKRSSEAKGEGKKEQACKQGSSRKQAGNQNSPSKRTVGRPPKPNASSPVTPKRSRETEGAASKQPRKRSRR